MEETYLFIDTETTGFFKSGSLIQDGQARVCQIAMLLTDSNGKHLAEFSCLVKPDGWTISQGASDIHGFTDELCEQYGMPFKDMLAVYGHFVSRATRIVAHNSEFDKKMRLS